MTRVFHPPGVWTSWGRGPCLFLFGSFAPVCSPSMSSVSVSWIGRWVRSSSVLSETYTWKELGKLQTQWQWDFLLFSLHLHAVRAEAEPVGDTGKNGCQEDTWASLLEEASAQNVLESWALPSWTCFLWEVIPTGWTAFLEKLPCIWSWVSPRSFEML